MGNRLCRVAGALTSVAARVVVAAVLLAAGATVFAADARVAALATQLGNNPATMFAHLRDQVGVDNYGGALRGAAGTIASKAGNALDRATLLVELLRAAGYTARYANGTLGDADTRRLITGSFPGVRRALGCYNPAPLAAPAFDIVLYNQARNHYWVEYKATPAAPFTALDPSFPESVAGQTFVAATTQFDAVPEALKHKVRFRVDAETFSQAGGIYGFGPARSTVLDVTFAAAELVDQPVTVGHFVTSSVTPGLTITATTNVYSPYLVVGAAGTDPRAYEARRGADYTEILTNFPLGSTIATGAFLVIDVVDPSGATTQSFERSLFDRIGYATRVNGGAISVDTTAPAPATTSLDLLTVNVSPGRQPLDGFVQRHALLTALQTELAGLAPAVNALPPAASQSAADAALVGRAVSANRAATMATLELLGTAYAGAADRSNESWGAAYLVKPYIGSPRLTIAQAKVTGGVLSLGLDLRKSDLVVWPLPGVAYLNARHFERARGLVESVLEGEVLAAVTGEPVRHLASVWSGIADPSRVAALTPQNAADVDALALPAEAKARIRDALLANRVVLVPDSPLPFGGTPTTVWLESDPATGRTISTFADGTHGAMAEYAAIYAYRFGENDIDNQMAKFIGKVNAFGVVGVAFTASVVASLTDGSEFREVLGHTKETIAEFAESKLNEITTWLKFTVAEGLLKGPYGQVNALVSGLLEGLELAHRVLLVALQGDPPVPPILISSPLPPLPANVAPGATAGVALALAPDARFHVPVAGAELASVYLATITNTGPATDSFRVVSNGSQFPFGLLAPGFPVTLPTGGSGEVSVCLSTESALPAAGTARTFQALAQSTTNFAVTAAQNGSLSVPATRALLMRIVPGSASALPGTTLAATLTLDSLGNTATPVTLTTGATTGLGVTGVPATVTLAAGESRSFPLTIAVGSGAAPGSTLGVVVSGDFGGSAPAAATYVVDVTSALTPCTAAAALAANDLGRTGLGGTLARLTAAMDTLGRAPADAAAKQGVLLELDALANLQFNAPYLAPFVAPVAAHRTTLAAATPAAVPGLLAALEATLCGVKAALVEASTNDFRVGLVPSVAANMPSQATTVGVNIYNDTALPRVFDVAVGGVPAGVTATFNTATITVPPNYFTNGFASPVLNLQFTNTGGTARAFGYTVTATPRDRQGVAKTAAGDLVLRPDIVRVVDLAATPKYAAAGSPIAFVPKIMNSINAERTVAGSWVVRDKGGIARRNGNMAAIALASGDNVVTAPSFAVDTTGFADGPYTIDLYVYDTAVCCDPLPGATYTGAFLVGQPFSAVLSATPTVVAPGSSTVTMRLDLSHDARPTPAITARGALPIPAAARSIARSGNYLYVCQEDRVSIVDAANPDALAIVGTFATGLLGTGYGGVGCNVNGNTLVLAYSGDSPSSFDTVKIVAFDIGGANATAPVQQNATPVDLGRLFGAGIAFVGSTGYLPTSIYIYNPFSQFIFEQWGNLLALDFSTPSAPVLSGELFHHFPSPSTDTNHPQYGGPNMVNGAVISGNYVLLPSTTSTGGGVNAGVGRLVVVDRTALPGNCPGSPNPCIVTTVDVPEARTLFGIARQGNVVLAVGDSVGFYDARSGLTGALTVTAFDISNPASPTKLSTLVTPLANRRAASQCNQSLDAAGSTLTALANDFYAVGAFNPQSCAWVMTLIDATNPAELRVIPYDVTDVLATTLLDGSTLYALTRTGILVYDYAINAGPAFTASVDVPKGSGVAVVPASFSLAPTTVDSSAADRDRYVWQQPTAATITWQEALTGMPFGGTRTVATGGRVDFTLPTLGAGSLALNPVAVTSDQTLSIAPASQVAGLGKPATYTLTLVNPTATPVTYALAVGGVPASWVKALPASIVVPASGQATATLVLQTTLGDLALGYPFTVTATTGGIATSAQAVFAVNFYDRDLGTDNTQFLYATTVGATPQPAHAGRGTTTTVRLTTSNTGNAPQRLHFVAANLPSGWTMSFDRSDVDVPADGATDFIAAIRVPATAAAGSYDLGVDLYTGSFFFVSRTTVTVVVGTSGVTVAVTPATGSAATAFSATITNAGLATDTFDLATLGPLGGAVTPAQAAVTLAAGASQVVALALGNTGFLPQGTSSFDVQATSRTDAAARARATAQVTLGPRKAVSLAATPANATVGSTPSSRTFAIQVGNAGNVEDSYAVRVKSTAGAVNAALRDAAGAAVQNVAPLRLPGLASGLLALDATLAGGSAGSVTLEAVSQSDSAVVATTTVTLATGAAPALSLAPGALGFGALPVGTTSAAQTATATNIGSAALTLGSVAVAGTNAADFALAGDCTGGRVLAPGATCTLSLSFTPAAAGARSASVSIGSDAAGSPHALALSGTGMSVNTCYTGPLPGGGTATACFTGGGASCRFAGAAFIAVAGAATSPPAGSAPQGYVFPAGLLDFATTGCAAGGTIDFSLTLPNALPSGTVFYRYGPSTTGAPPSWFVAPATVGGSTVAFSLPAGDLAAIGGPAYPTPAAIVAPVPVPAVDRPALALLALAVALVVVSRRSRRR